MRTHQRSPRPGIRRPTYAALALTLIACAQRDGTGPTNTGTLVPVPLQASSGAMAATNPALPVYLVPQTRTVPYRSLTTQQRQRVDQALALLAARNAGKATGCVSAWSDPGSWIVSCSANGYTCTISHNKSGHSTACVAS